MAYYVAKDFIIAAALAFQHGDHAAAAKHMQKAAEAEDFEDTLDSMNEEQQEALMEDDGDSDVSPSGEETARKRATASFKRALARVSVMAGEDEDMDDDELVDDEADDESDEDTNTDGADTDEINEEVTARLRARQARTRANMRVVSGLGRKTVKTAKRTGRTK